MLSDPDSTMERPKKYKKSQRETALKLLDEYSYNQVSEMTGISRRTLIRYKQEQRLLND